MEPLNKITIKNLIRKYAATKNIYLKEKELSLLSLEAINTYLCQLLIKTPKEEAIAIMEMQIYNIFKGK